MRELSFADQLKLAGLFSSHVSDPLSLPMYQDVLNKCAQQTATEYKIPIDTVYQILFEYAKRNMGFVIFGSIHLNTVLEILKSLEPLTASEIKSAQEYIKKIRDKSKHTDWLKYNIVLRALSDIYQGEIYAKLYSALSRGNEEKAMDIISYHPEIVSEKLFRSIGAVLLYEQKPHFAKYVYDYTGLANIQELEGFSIAGGEEYSDLLDRAWIDDPQWIRKNALKLIDIAMQNNNKHLIRFFSDMRILPKNIDLLGRAIRADSLEIFKYLQMKGYKLSRENWEALKNTYRIQKFMSRKRPYKPRVPRK